MTPTQEWLQTEELKSFNNEVKAMQDKQLAQLYRLVSGVGHELGRLGYFAKSLYVLQCHFTAYDILVYREVVRRSGYDQRGAEVSVLKNWLKKSDP